MEVMRRIDEGNYGHEVSKTELRREVPFWRREAKVGDESTPKAKESVSRNDLESPPVYREEGRTKRVPAWFRNKCPSSDLLLPMYVATSRSC